MSKLHLLNRSVSTTLYALEFLVSALILGIFSYFLAKLAGRDGATIPQWEKAVEGMSGAAVLYTIFAVLLTCFFGGITFLAFVAVVLDVCFCACMVAIAILTRAGSKTCGSVNDSPIGPGNHLSCRLQKVVFAVSIIGAFLFAISVISQIALSRSHKREKRYGPSPSNNYTSGSGKRRPWQRKKKAATRDTELGAAGPGGFNNDHKRTSDMTGTTAPVNDQVYGGPTTKYSEPTIPTHTHAPQTTGVLGSGNNKPIVEMDNGQTHALPNPYAQNANPYAEVHGGGYVH
ncbi:uncharacterized protein KY384_003066 [Bacidia gigantensis]|uniref:uncharacterized protein n=1 Tax=Bacidia gigantensis TaxID=2732470 RepID=UPI001D03C5AE|nr:uncharacterized protein KY384_003066 [Bacidia gigantensis]KAG8531437.1 hypothetical protein KY384_003066 [Bacidia gigantensis]